jgi:hypothetical protein
MRQRLPEQLYQGKQQSAPSGLMLNKFSAPAGAQFPKRTASSSEKNFQKKY